MRIRWVRFNIYLLAAVVLACGCQSPESRRKSIVCTLRLHEEANADPSGRTEVVTVYTNPAVTLTISKPFVLSEGSVDKAKVIDTVGGFALSIQFDRQGTWLLEQFTTTSRGKHIAIFSQFVNCGEQKLNKGRWLAAPKIANRITDGLLTFTPNVTRAEADQIALGLNNVSRQVHQDDFKD